MTRILADAFTNLYPVSKTLRFELRPVGKTQEYVERDGIIDTDTKRAADYVKVKKIIDRYHKAFIDKALTGISLSGLNAYAEIYSVAHKSDAQAKEFEKLQDSMRKQISDRLKKAPEYKTIFKKELIKKDLVSFVRSNDEETALINSFSEFTTYFTGFHQNRENMYSPEAKGTAIGYRVIHQNLPKYLDNAKIFRMICETEIAEKLPELTTALAKMLGDNSIVKFFEVEGFNKVVPQSGIDVYNTILGGVSEENGKKIQGLNEYINLYNQKNHTKYPKLKPLFKQILSDRDSFSYIPEQFEDDVELISVVNDTLHYLEKSVLTNDEELSVCVLLENMPNYDSDGLLVKNDVALTTISQYIFGDWSVVKNAIQNNYDMSFGNGKPINEKYEDARRKYLSKIPAYSVKELNTYLAQIGHEVDVERFFIEQVSVIAEKIQSAYYVFRDIDASVYAGGKSLKRSDKDVAAIKNVLDAWKELQWLIKPLVSADGDAKKDESFYSELQRIWETIDIITPLYNKVRNYVTSKPYSLEKVKLNFGKDTLLNGWDKNKERDNLGIILMKDGAYYLGIINRSNTRCIQNAPEASSASVYKKMNYKYLPGPNKMLPKVFFAASNADLFKPSPELLAKYEAKTHIKGDNFNIDDCHALIDFFKASIEKHADWRTFEFKFSDTSSYENISGFYREVAEQGYRITYTDIDESYIDKLVSAGELYLFQIYNKDFSPYSKGTPNLHTLYWKELFSPENLANVVYKLNGEAEVFYRKASIDPRQTTIHPANEVLQNKDPLNAKETSLFAYDIVKDRRFTCDKYQFHVPITMNFKAEGEERVSRKVNRALQTAENFHIIGIDRGERNLLYISVIDSEGKIVEQMSLNTILSYDKNENLHTRDFHQMLTEREKANIKARQDWTTTGTIKELKEGYLSQVIHVITELMMKYNAIVVLEDLNFGFKRGRQKFERQVYQKFEKMLIDKLNYYADKKLPKDQKGGLLHAYQLTEKFESFQKLGKQSGFLFYVPAWNTSKIDPTTGFVNLFYTKYESVNNSKAFFGKFSEIRYDAEQGMFAFSFDYSDFTFKADGTQTKWTVYSNGERIDHYRNKEKNSEWDVKYIDLTKELHTLFAEYDVVITESDMRGAILAVDAAEFYRQLMKLFSLVLQMRNSDEAADVDMMISPVLNSRGEFFRSGEAEGLPKDADANGAYNIAKKGLFLVQKMQETEEDKIDKIKLAISNKEWLEFAQANTL